MPSRMPKEQMEKVVLLAIGGVVFALLLLQFVTLASLRGLSEINGRISKARQELKKNEALIANKAQMEKRFTFLTEKMKTFESALPPYSNMHDIQQGISRIAGEAKVKIIKIETLKMEKQQPIKADVRIQAMPQQAKAQASKPTVAPIYTEIPIKIEAKGSYHALGGFLNRLENAKNIMTVSDIEIKSNSEDMFVHNVRLLIVAYVLREEVSGK